MLCEGALQVTKLLQLESGKEFSGKVSILTLIQSPYLYSESLLKCLMSKSLAQGKLIMVKKHFKMLISLIWLSFACPIECQDIINLLVGKFGLLKI